MTSAIDFTPDTDGVNHINIVHTKGKTELGRALSNLADIGFEHPVYGKFRTMEGYWYWVATGMNQHHLRGLDGYTSKYHGRNMERVPNPHFEQLICQGLTAKVTQNPALIRLIVETGESLPLTHYYAYGHSAPYRIINKPEHQWQVDHLTALRSWLCREYALPTTASTAVINEPNQQ